MHKTLSLLLLAVCVPLAAQTPYLVKDINTTIASFTRSSSPSFFVRHGNRVYFAATTPDEGTELWSVDDNGGARLAMDIVPGTGSSNPFPGIGFNGLLFFTARDTEHGLEWWTTDGTTAGTHLFMDINPGPNSGQPFGRTLHKNRLFFSADNGVNGRELWSSDGTPAGTRLLKDLNPGSANGSPGAFTPLNDTLYFIAAGGLWKTDGTEAGTVQVAGIQAMRNLVALGNQLIFEGFSATTGWELWASDGTEAGTRMVTEILPGVKGALETTFSLAGFAVLGDRVIFHANDLVHGRELWVSDGTVAGTRMLRDFNPGPTGQWDSGYAYATAFGDRVYFSATDAEHGTEVWITDGTPAGTALFADLNPGTRSTNPSSLIVSGGKLFFSSVEYGAHGGTRLNVTDGTVAGTHVLGGADEFASFNIFGSSTAIDGKLYFGGYDRLNGTEPWISDGTDAGTRMIVNLVRDDAPSSVPGNLTAAGDQLFFYAQEGVINPSTGASEASLWSTDGTAAGTVKLMEAGQHPPALTPAGPLVFFQPSFKKWWLSDGTPAGTKSADDFLRRFGGSPLGTLFPFGDALFATILDIGSSDASLWTTTAAPDAPATRLGARNPTSFVDVAGRQLFYSRLPFGPSDFAMWTTDGTPAGTYAVIPDLGDTQALGPPVNAGGTLFFLKQLRDEKPKLWKSDGTIDGTKVVKEIPEGGVTANMVAAGRKVFFVTGTSLWVSDGTEGGTAEVFKAPLFAFRSERFLWAAGERVVFSQWDQTRGYDLWGSDGTVAGTKLLLAVGPYFRAATIDGTVYFAGSDDGHGSELWTTDGTAEGTRLRFDVNPGPKGSNPDGFTKVGTLLYLSAYTEATGLELWAVPLAEPRLSAGDIRTVEGDASTTTARFTVSLAPAAEQSVTVEYATADGTAVAGQDYDAASGTLTFAAGETAKTIDVRVRGDAIVETNETFFLTLRNAAGASLLKGEGFALIEEDDSAADLGIGSVFTNSFSRIDDSVKVTNSGPSAATDIVVQVTATPAISTFSQRCTTCSIPQLLPSTSASTAGGSLDASAPVFFTATASARQRDPQPGNNTTGWVITADRYTGMNALYLTPGASATVTAANSAGAMTVTCTDPTVVSVPSSISFVTGQPATFTVTGLKPGTASIRIGTFRDPLPIIVVAAGTTPRYPGAVSITGDLSTSLRFDNPIRFTITPWGTAPYSGAKATGVVRVTTTGGTEVARQTLGSAGAMTIQFYPQAIGPQQFTISYGGDANFLPQDAASNINVIRGAVTLTGGLRRVAGSTTTFTLMVHAKGSPATPPTGTLTVKNGTTVVTSLPLAAAANEATATATLTNLPEAPTLTIDYSGDAFHATASQQIRVTEPRRHPARH